ncbi:MAG: pseudouridine synthase, RluA family, partial [Bryobacterales bacterium]|nr:pseudouridine synthase, RluA family [Bryobacterales bacterium]
MRPMTFLDPGAFLGTDPKASLTDCPCSREIRLPTPDAASNSRRRCYNSDSTNMLNRGYAYTTIISSKHQGRTLLSHLASLYPHSTPQAWQQNL